MVRSITAFACALIANADYICTTTPASNDCQCLTIVEDMSGRSNQLAFYVYAPGAAAAAMDEDCDKYYHFGCDVVIRQSNFTEKDGGIAYTHSSGEKLCVSGAKDCDECNANLDMVPCDYHAEGGIFILPELLHVGGGAPHGHDECLEPGHWNSHDVSLGNCSSRWTISPVPSCGGESEMVIA